MIIKEGPKVSNDELAIAKVATWTLYGHGTRSESSHIVTGTSRYNWEARENAQQNITASTHYFPRSILCTTHVGSSLLDAYEIERISKDLDRYMQSSCDKYYRRNFVDVSGPRIMPSESLKRDCSRIKEDKTSKETKWLGFREVYKLCGSIEGSVVENVQLPTLSEGR